MSTLTISHYIYLTREQRYQLHSGTPLDVVGISVPVWFDKGNTSEPAREVFCNYKLTNEPMSKAIVPFEEGYSINLPQKNKEAIAYQPETSERLLDIKDGGVEGIEFRQNNKVHQGDKKFNIVHFVDIKSDELLKDTLN